MSRLPRFIAGNIVVDGESNPWAVYRMTPWLYAVGSVAERRRVLDSVAAFAGAIPYRALVLGVAHEAPPGELRAMVAGTTGSRPSARWNRYIADATTLVTPTIWREWWVAIALHRPSGTVGEITTLFRRAVTRTSKRLEGEDPDALDLAAWRQEAAHFVAQLGPIGDRLEPATDTAIRWLYARAFRRGTSHEPQVDDVEGVHNIARLIDVEPVRGVAYSAVSEIGEGDHAHVAVVRIDDVPRKMVVPGPAQWVWEVNRLGFNADAVIWLEAIPAAQAEKKGRRRRNNLADQSRQHAGVAGAPASLNDHQDDYDLMEQQLSLSRLPLMKATYAVVVGADDAATLKERVSQVRGLFAGGLFKAYAPAGVQRQLIAATCPGMPWPAAVTSKNVSQLGMPDSVAASAPFCGIDLGDPHGILLGTTATGLREPVFFDPAWGPTRAEATSGSLVVVGKTGSGKGVTAKTMLTGALAAGHQVVIFDRSVIRHTGRGEYEQFLSAVDCTSQVITLHETGATLNPWMCLPLPEARLAAQELCMQLCQVTKPTDSVSLVINAACEFAQERRARGLGNGSGWDLLLHALDEWASRSPEARHVAQTLRYIQAQPAARSIFATGAPLRFDADATVIWAPNLRLPEPGDDDLELEQVIGRAVMGLVVLCGRHLFAANPGRYGALLIDEAWALLSTKVGARWVTEFAREGRKAALGVWIFTQLPGDVPPDVLKQMGYVGVTRVDADQVPEAMRILGLPHDSDAAELVSHEGTGVLTWRDAQGRVGAIHVLMPDDQQLRAAMDTTPLVA